MKTHLIILLICIPCLLFAQNYEKEGDELFAKAQYEKAEKKYAAAIEITGSNAALNQKKAKCAKCLSLLTKAQTAERQANDIKSYELARTYYLDLYKEHALSAHKNKADAMRQKANAIAEQQRVAEQAERDRLAKIEQEKRDKAEAEQKARIEREKRAQEQKIAQQEEEARKAKAREDAAAKKRKAEAERKQKEVENLSQLSQILNAPLGLSNIKWTDSKRKVLGIAAIMPFFVSV